MSLKQNDIYNEQQMENKIQKLKELLMKYTDPKPGYDGMTAHELVTIILRELNN